MGTPKNSNQTPRVPEVSIRVKANGYFLDFTGELYQEAALENFVDEATGRSGKRNVTRPLKIGELLARHVAEGLGVPPERKFTCAMLGGKLFDHMSLEGEKGWFAVSAEQMSLIKTVVDNIQFRDSRGMPKESQWLKASALYALDPESANSDPEAKAYLKAQYAKLDEKTAQWESRNPKEDNVGEDQPSSPVN